MNKGKREKENRKSPWGKHRNVMSQQGPRMDAKISGQKFGEKEDLHGLKVSPPQYLLITKEIQ